jgi:ABC-type nitrate/sulfonate/bicarbonate transport system ATPase subunit
MRHSRLPVKNLNTAYSNSCATRGRALRDRGPIVMGRYLPDLPAYAYDLSGAAHIPCSFTDGPRLDCAVIFQGHALMPWLSALRKVELAVFSRHPNWTRHQVREHAMNYLALVHLDGSEAKKPAQLSGGMKQRVGIARALAIQSRMLPMDEPFSTLDALTRGALQDEVIAVRNATRNTVFMITHDIDEALLLADNSPLLAPRPPHPGLRVRSSPLAYRLPMSPLHEEGNAKSTSSLTRIRAWVRSLAGGRIASTTAEQPKPDLQPHEHLQGETPMKREQPTEKILDIKREKGWSWKQICNEIGGVSPVLVVGALLGHMKLVKPLAKKAAGLFGLPQAEERMLNEVP